MAPGIPLAQMMVDLRRLCGERRTGMVFITTDNNHLAQLSLEQGEIVYLFFNKQHGIGALQDLRLVKGGHLRFTLGAIPAFRSVLPTTAEILDFLQDRGDPSAPNLDPSGTAAPVAKSGLTEREKVILQEELTEFIGPMAAIVCQENLASAPDLNAALDGLSRNLPDPAQATRFVSNVKRRLKG
ncbi:MAG: DUF4388 domain-containing protein [Gammaproteobacteria bacterium]|nr:DUF4388 domain-containing protein [Gammaproteobacteria bacterium]MCP5458009.1 DUF4388 domain-containing protein [Gammaproteobacteria bacterium]